MERVILHEVGLRDGLQIERQIVPIEKKIEWAERLIASGVDILQLGSFVHPAKVPQMADTDHLFEYFNDPARKPRHVILSGLVLNEKGLERGLRCGVDNFCMGVSASETHSRKNSGMSTAEATQRTIAMAKEALAADKVVQVSVQSAFGCGFEGVIQEQRVLDIVRQFVDNGLLLISLADTAGHAHPQQVERMFGAIHRMAPEVELACHFHDTFGLGVANAWAAWRAGVRYFESAFGGLGGCPFTAVTAGNVCTEDLVHLLQRNGEREDVELETIIEVANDAEKFFGRPLPGVIHRTGPVSRVAASAK